MNNNYPARKPFYAHRFTQLLAQSIGQYAPSVRNTIDSKRRQRQLYAIIEQTSGLEPEEMRFVLAEVFK